MRDLVGQVAEWRDVTGYDYDGVVQRIEVGPDGEVAVCSQVRKRNWMDDHNREGGAHETIALKGERRVRLAYVVESGPCSYPRQGA